jgi:hypothetical protein
MAYSEKRYYGEFFKLFIDELIKFSVDSEDFGFRVTKGLMLSTFLIVNAFKS